jgi:hypothetical protein
MIENYKIEAENLAKAIDIAVEVISECPPMDWDELTNNSFLEVYLGTKKDILNPKPQYANLKSLKYSIDEIFTLFQESSGKTYDIFWKKIKEAGLPYKRENKLIKMLKRGQINNDIEYNFIIDAIVPYQQEGLINNEEVEKLNKMIGDFENKHRK